MSRKEVEGDERRHAPGHEIVVVRMAESVEVSRENMPLPRP
jgi:hypothetical protein